MVVTASPNGKWLSEPKTPSKNGRCHGKVQTVILDGAKIFLGHRGNLRPTMENFGRMLGINRRYVGSCGITHNSTTRRHPRLGLVAGSRDRVAVRRKSTSGDTPGGDVGSRLGGGLHARKRRFNFASLILARPQVGVLFPGNQPLLGNGDEPKWPKWPVLPK